jgi:flagella basal body P-ring formation protein FlgA
MEHTVKLLATKVTKTLLWIFFSCFLTCSYATQEEADFLTNVARQYMLAQFNDESDDKKYVIKVGRIDAKRDYGGKCPGYLTAEIAGNEIKKNNTVRITCSRKEKPYRINVNVSVNILRKIIVAADNIPRGSVITRDMLDKTYVSETANMASLITEENLILGTKTRKDLKAGEAIKISDFCIIAKGDTVTIIAQSKNLSIKTQGIALEEGRLNDQIQIKNIKTQKVITGVIRGPGVVEVIF